MNGKQEYVASSGNKCEYQILDREADGELRLAIQAEWDDVPTDADKKELELWFSFALEMRYGSNAELKALDQGPGIGGLARATVATRRFLNTGKWD